MPLRPPPSTSVLARKPIGYLSHHPRLWAGGWRGSGSGARTPSIISSRWDNTQGGVTCLPCHGGGIPSPRPQPLAREGILRKEGPGSRPCPQPPQTHPDLKAMRVRVYRNHVQRPEKPHSIPRGGKKTRQKLIYIFCIWSSILNINCVIFIHFLSLNSPLIYQFNVSRASFPTGFGVWEVKRELSRPAPTPLFDLRRLILSIVAFVRMLLPCKYAVIHTVNTLCFFYGTSRPPYLELVTLLKKRKPSVGLSVCISVAGR